MKLPRSKKEFALFMGIVSIISVNIIAPLITFFEAGFHLYVYRDVLIVLPLNITFPMDVCRSSA